MSLLHMSLLRLDQTWLALHNAQFALMSI